jgi:hypothetical protein
MRHIARLTQKCLLVPILLIVYLPIPASSSDAQGNYVALGGVEHHVTHFSKHGAIVSICPIDS